MSDLKRPYGSRFRDALAIVELGACNPSGIAHSIVEACREMREHEQADTDVTGDAIIGFPAHGTAKRKAEAVAVASRDVPAGASWTSRDHRTMREVIADEATAA
jgi:hypothetical protein